jgi:hypothetical protein
MSESREAFSDGLSAALLLKRNQYVVGAANPGAFQLCAREPRDDPLRIPLLDATTHALPQLWVYSSVSGIIWIVLVGGLCKVALKSAERS